VFNDNGELHSIPDVDAVACVNQLTAVFTKLKGGHTPQSEIDTIESFVKTEKEIESTVIDLNQLVTRWWWDGECEKSHSVPLHQVILAAQKLVRRVLHRSDPREISPKHGSGVSACGTKFRHRFATPRFIDKIDKVWPMSDYYYASLTAFCDKLAEHNASEVVDPCAKVLLVPKDARGPRLISCEPKETMWIQQGLMNLMYETIEEHPLTRGLVNFTNQWYNQLAAYIGSGSEAQLGNTIVPLALSELYDRETGRLDARATGVKDLINRNLNDKKVTEASRFATLVVRRKQTADQYGYPDLHQRPYSGLAGKLATLDLKDASDRIRLDVVKALFPENWYEALAAARSERTELPDGRLVTMRKHAPMGSATCFPVMALTIWSLLTAIAPKCDRHRILVYGDDIIVPTYMVQSAIAVLEAVGLIVNRNKSYSKGPFRESCGEEFFLGVRVTPVRLRKNPDDDIESCMSCMAFNNNMLETPYISDTGWFIKHMQDWYGKIPVMLPRQKAYSTRWSVQDQRLILRKLSGSVKATLSGVAYTDSPLLVDLPDGKDRRWNPKLQRWEARIRLPLPRTEKFGTGDWCHVLRALTTRLEISELGLDTVHNRVRYVRRWVAL
jgi:hypothetical protein